MRCAVYVRVSTDMSSQKSSIAHQKNFFEKYTKDKGWDIYNIYQDVESGMSVEKRSGLKQLIEDSNNRKFQIVLTKSISRFARNTLEGLQYIREFKKKNIRFITIEDAFDSEEYDEFMFTLLLSLAQKESEKISERIRFGKYVRAEKGYYNGSNPPYGYKKKGKNKLESAQDITTEVVRSIYKMYIEGNGLYKIAKYLNNNSFPTPSQVLKKTNSSNIWHQSTIRNILTNEVYIGNMVQNKTKTKDVLKGERKENSCDEYVEVANTHEGIIDLTIFSEVQSLMEQRSKRKHGNNTHLFSNLLYCGECGSAMHFKTNKDSYICGKVNKMGKKYCVGSYIKESVIKELVKAELQKQIKITVNLVTLNNSVKEMLRKTNEINSLSVINQEIGTMHKKMERLLDCYLDRLMSKEIFKKRKKSLDNQLEFLLCKRNRLKLDENMNSQKRFSSVEEIFNFIDIDNLALVKLVDKIEVFKKNKVKIHFNFNNGF